MEERSDVCVSTRRKGRAGAGRSPREGERAAVSLKRGRWGSQTRCNDYLERRHLQTWPFCCCCRYVVALVRNHCPPPHPPSSLNLGHGDCNLGDEASSLRRTRVHVSRAFALFASVTVAGRASPSGDEDRAAIGWDQRSGSARSPTGTRRPKGEARGLAGPGMRRRTA